MALLPRRGGVAVQRALSRARHRVFGRGRTSEDVETRCFEELVQMRVVLRDHAATQPAAELDCPARFVAEEVLDEKRNAAERTGAERLLIEAVNPIRVGLDDGVDGWIDRGDRRRRRLRELLRRYLFVRDQVGKAKGIVAGVFGKVHHAM